MSPFRHVLDEYLGVRRALGFKLERAGYLLPQFITFLEQQGTGTLTTALALRWAQLPAEGHPAWWAERLSIVRGFARYLQTLDSRTEVPAAELLPRRTRRVTPYLFSARDLIRLMEATQKLHSRRRITYASLIGLLATTGMRVGEVIRLNRRDVDWANQLLVVRGTKFGKSREVPLHDSTVEALRAYGRRRDQLHPRPTAPSFFLSTTGTQLIYNNVQCTFRTLVRMAGLELPATRRQPRLHDLRHSFAVGTLIDWYRDGGEIEPRLPLLSTYLGHFDPSSTYWYLSAAPELLALASQRLERVPGDRP